MFFWNFLLALCVFQPTFGTTTIFVSVSPYKEIVQEMIGDEAKVQELVPAGANFHTFEPTPSHAHMLSQSVVWFTIGDPCEEKAKASLTSFPHSPIIADLRENIDLIYESTCSSQCGADPHIWTSPKCMRIQLSTIHTYLQKAFPEKKEEIHDRYIKIDSELQQLINVVDQLLQNCKGKYIFVAHKAYAYLCRDYGLIQLSLEEEGKEPTFSQLETKISLAKKHSIHTLFSLHHFPKRGIERIASLLHASVVELDPSNPHYIANTKKTALAFSQATKDQR